MMKLLVLALSVSVFGCVIGDEGLEDGDEDILGGSTDAGDPSVVQLRFNTASAGGIGLADCTATAIAPTVLLTAAHCVQGSWNFQYNPAQSSNPFDPKSPGWINAQSGLAHPSYSGDPRQGHDVGLVFLASPIGVAPSAMGPAPAAGSIVRAVGYGNNQPTNTIAGVGSRRQVNIRVSSLAAHEFVAGVDLQGTCHGDSGGPVFQGGKVVGTTSYGTTADCRGAGHYMRVDDSRAFIDQFLGGASGGGGGTTSNTCSSTVAVNGVKKNVSCSNGTCQCKVNDVLASTCTANSAGCSIPGSCCGF